MAWFHIIYDDCISGAQFRKHRRLSNALLNPNASRGYAEMHERLAGTLLSALLNNPEKFHEHILMYVGTWVFNVAQLN